jgi:hypothetical protein
VIPNWNSLLENYKLSGSSLEALWELVAVAGILAKFASLPFQLNILIISTFLYGCSTPLISSPLPVDSYYLFLVPGIPSPILSVFV